MDNTEILCDIKQKCLDIIKALGYNRAQIIVDISADKKRAEIKVNRVRKIKDKTYTITEVL